MPTRHFHVDVKQDLRVHTSKTELDSIPSPSLPSSRLPHLTNRHHYSLSCSGKTLRVILNSSLFPLIQLSENLVTPLSKHTQNVTPSYYVHHYHLTKPPSVLAWATAVPPTWYPCFPLCSGHSILYPRARVFFKNEYQMLPPCSKLSNNFPSHLEWHLNSSPFLTKPCTVSAVYLSASSPTALSLPTPLQPHCLPCVSLTSQTHFCFRVFVCAANSGWNVLAHLHMPLPQSFANSARMSLLGEDFPVHF